MTSKEPTMIKNIYSITRWTKQQDGSHMPEHVVDTMFYNEANFFYHISKDYDVEVITEIGLHREFVPSPAYKVGNPSNLPKS